MALKTLDAETITVPLNRLDVSAANARRTGREAEIEALAASIHAHGLLQNLGVVPILDAETGEPTGRYEVVAGARRLAALRALAEARRIAKSAPIPCRLVEDRHAAEASLAENVV
ncbi:MAG: ParB/Srx family N-terminal domain-containing protein, partial [Thermoleophilia bacterium]|nr:ParB/Srx family N-terminal domain-containing protein [Thermoleophilia bacterium]